jgi:hypothetical protein
MSLLSSWNEKVLGLGPASRRLYFGAQTPKSNSVLLAYAAALLDDARSGESAAAGAQPTAPTLRQTLGDLLDDLKNTPEDLKSFVSEFTEKQPKILPGDTLTPHERVARHIRFEKADRVAVAPQLGFHIAHAGGIPVREFMTRGVKAARAARRAWDLYGGFDMLPYAFPAGYLFPFVPDSHTRFWNRWVLPDGDELPKLEEIPLLAGLQDVLDSGIMPLARTEGGHLLRELAGMSVQVALYAALTARLFPRPDLYYPYATAIINHPADLLSFWMGFEPFMMACATEPARMREACEAMAPGLVEAGSISARLMGSKNVLYGVSRVSGSYISRKMFDDLFAGTFKMQIEMLHAQGYTIAYHLDNNYDAMLDFFLELPRHSGFMHLDQTDLFKAKKVLHGHLCLMGNLHPGLAATGAPVAVEAACERLIKEVGAGGGFILSNACETPKNMPPDNLRAMKRAVDRWGWV